jgi:hypothetical protein
MARQEDLDEPITALLAAIKTCAEGVPTAKGWGATRDIAEAGERFANATRVLLEARAKLPGG